MRSEKWKDFIVVYKTGLKNVFKCVNCIKEGVNF